MKVHELRALLDRLPGDADVIVGGRQVTTPRVDDFYRDGVCHIEHLPVDPRRRLTALWDVLDARGAAVRRVDVEQIPGDVAAALCNEESRRVRALLEGAAAGWTPDWRERQATVDPEALTPAEAARIRELIAGEAQGRGLSERMAVGLTDDVDSQDDTTLPTPIRVQRHRPEWRATA
jgi:hypothetical protein